MGIRWPIPRDDAIASAAMMAVGMLGMTINIYVFIGVRRATTHFGYAFGNLCLSHTVANLGIASTYTIFVGPVTLLTPDFHKTYWGERFGQILILFWNAAVFSHLLIAINRCVRMYKPVFYEKIFTRFFTIFTIGMAWTLAFCQVFSYFWEECTFGFVTKKYAFEFADKPCSYYIGKIFDYYMSIFMICTIASLDFCTFLKIRKFKKVGVSTPNSATEYVKNPAAMRRIRDVRFFFQTVVQGMAFMAELVSFFSISVLFTNRWAQFGFTTVAWIAVHTIDGCIVIVFNREVRKAVGFLCIEPTPEPPKQMPNTTTANTKSMYRNVTMMERTVYERELEVENVL
ncbi:hypothetical protein QR680_007180 [Steinernema hermaphroditum]|uniref:7TM GPCR serpentine receptor class x (Srx) domain-containing protein n=1 Tax=Steinernema hermaphroditum TaxID=289476 RepID=A0AA39HZH3_9BILA|nr:hypothetical protein QR680_007180 [Steinernema hermaphroditum]